MSTYKQRLNEFADGKRLVRLSRPLRDRADASCDACGSTRPRILYGLKDGQSERCYFVGDTCLKELVARGIVLRRFGQQSGREEFEREMQRRTNRREEKPLSEITGDDNRATSTGCDTLASRSEIITSPGFSIYFPVIYIASGPDYYEAFVFVLSPHGGVRSSGYAKENRFDEVWTGGGEKGILLEKVKRECPDALNRSVAKAWRSASTGLEVSEIRPPTTLTSMCSV